MSKLVTITQKEKQVSTQLLNPESTWGNKIPEKIGMNEQTSARAKTILLQKLTEIYLEQLITDTISFEN